MPQLMPLFWNISIFMVTFIFLFMVIYYYNSIITNMFVDDKMVLSKEKIWLW